MCNVQISTLINFKEVKQILDGQQLKDQYIYHSSKIWKHSQNKSDRIWSCYLFNSFTSLFSTDVLNTMKGELDRDTAKTVTADIREQ